MNEIGVDWQSEALRLVDELHRAATELQRAVLRNDVAAIPRLAQQEAHLAGLLSRTLQQVPATGGAEGGKPRLPEALREKARAWWALHRQNRMLLEHAHQTVVALIEALAGAAQEPAGLYSADGLRGAAGSEVMGRPLVTAVDQRV